MVTVVRLQHYTQSWIFLVRETAFFELILLPALEFTCVTTSASRWVFCLCVVCISMRVERCSLFSFPSPCPEKWLKLTSYFIYALFHPTSLLLVRIYEARKPEPNCSSVSFSPFLVLVCFLFDFLLPVQNTLSPAWLRPPSGQGSPNTAPCLVKAHALTPVSWDRSLKLVGRNTNLGVSLMCKNTGIWPLFSPFPLPVVPQYLACVAPVWGAFCSPPSHWAPSSLRISPPDLLFFFPGSRLDKGGTLSCGWYIQINCIVFFLFYGWF